MCGSARCCCCCCCLFTASRLCLWLHLGKVLLVAKRKERLSGNAASYEPTYVDTPCFVSFTPRTWTMTIMSTAAGTLPALSRTLSTGRLGKFTFTQLPSGSGFARAVCTTRQPKLHAKEDRIRKQQQQHAHKLCPYCEADSHCK